MSSTLNVPVTRGVPELGPMLGRLGEPAPSSGTGVELELARVALLNSLFAAAGRAREAMDRGDEAGARQALALPVWLELFGGQALALADQCGAACHSMVEEAIRSSRMPAGPAGQLLPGDDDRRLIRNRAAAAGIALERAADPALVADWTDGLRGTAMALEVSWHQLGGVLVEELRYWQQRASAAAGWSRPRTPLHLITALVLAGAVLLGLAIGGYLPAPGFLGTLQTWWWSLPWP